MLTWIFIYTKLFILLLPLDEDAGDFHQKYISDKIFMITNIVTHI